MHGVAVCAGVAGLELGLALVFPGYRTVCYVEREAFAAAQLVARMAAGQLDPAPVWDDVRTFDGRRFRGVVDLVTAGFPCQPWSKAGQDTGTDDARWIWPDILDRIGEMGPAVVYLENVPPFVSRGGLATVLGGLADSGYAAEWGVLPASAVGASHERLRIFIVAYRDGVRLRRQVADASQPRLQGRERRRPSGSRERPQASRPAAELHRALFPPAPTDAAGWQFVFADRPDLAPALSAAHQRQLRGMADGISHRLDRLRAVGNGVVPLQAAYAFVALATRAGLWAD
jgi:DNA (cytosine-5)-methyltransferase 1